MVAPEQERRMTWPDWGGAVIVALYILILAGFLFYTLYAVWPPAPQDRRPPPSGAGQSTTAGVSPQAAGLSNEVTAEADSPPMHWFGRGYVVTGETRLLVIVVLAGALGGLLHALRSLYWYAGNQKFFLSWLLMYLMLPFVGAILGLGFYFVIRGGFFAPSTGVAQTSPYGFAAFSFLIGLFSQEAVVKLKQIAETVFVRPQPGQDAEPQTPTSSPPADFVLSVIAPTRQAAGGTDASFILVLKSLFGFTGPVTLSASGLPVGTAASCSPPSLLPTVDGVSAELVVTTQGVAPGSYPFTVIGTGGGRTHQAALTLVVEQGEVRGGEDRGPA